MTTIPDPGPSITVHDTAAARLLGDVQSLVQTVRGYGFISRSERRRINPTATLPTEFLLAVAVALDSSEKLRQMAEITGDQMRDAISFCNAYGPAADEMRLKAEGVLQTVRAHRFEVGQVALRVYRFARGFHTPSEKEQLVPHVENMKRLLARGPKKKAAAKEDPANAAAKATAKEGTSA